MDASTRQDSPELPTMNGTSIAQKPARKPSLLPAFELFSSPPARPTKSARLNYSDDAGSSYSRAYPTPVPTSSTGMLPSSPGRRPDLLRAPSNVSERSPLVDVPTATVPADGRPLLVGRSSSSCHVQVPRNGFVSRVHVSVGYEQPTPGNESGQIVVKCLGWNGCSVHCRGRVQALSRDDSFVSTDPAVDIMLDVLDTRVILQWPDGVRRAPSPSAVSDDGWCESPTRAGRGRLASRSLAPPPSSPPAAGPVSPPMSPRHQRRPQPARSAAEGGGFEVYEDRASSEEPLDAKENVDPNRKPPPAPPSSAGSLSPLSSRAPSPGPGDGGQSEDENEENEPVVHAMGPFGSNVLSRFNDFSTTSPLQPASERAGESNPRKRARRASSPPPLPRHPFASPIRNHVVNQLAFSRVHAVPLSSIMGNLPAELRAAPASAFPALDGGGPVAAAADDDADKVEGKARDGGLRQLTTAELRAILRGTACVGEIARSGKDAAGKPLENEFYYVPERDDSAMRREAVVAGAGRTSLRAVRRNHKVGFIFLSLIILGSADARSNTSGRSRGSEIAQWAYCFSRLCMRDAFSVAFFSFLFLLAVGGAPLAVHSDRNHFSEKPAYLTHTRKTTSTQLRAFSTPSPKFRRILLSAPKGPQPTENDSHSVSSAFVSALQLGQPSPRVASRVLLTR
jgi:hypothetical protein